MNNPAHDVPYTKSDEENTSDYDSDDYVMNNFHKELDNIYDKILGIKLKLKLLKIYKIEIEYLNYKMK